MNKDKWQVIDFKIGDIVIYDWYEKGTGERLAKTGEIVYMSKVDNTVNVKCHFSGMVVNVGKEILRFNSLSSNSKNYGDTSC